MPHLRLFAEASTLVRRVDDVGTGTLLEEVELAHDGAVAKGGLIEKWFGGIALQYLGGRGQHWTRRGLER